MNNPAAAAPAVLTRSNDNTRSGANTAESILTPAAVKARGIKRLFSLETPGDARGCEAQPLVVPGVTVADGSTHTVVYLATMANDVFAYDAGNGALLWHVNFGTPVTSVIAIDNPGTGKPINDHWGIVSTPVIDRTAGVLYACAWISADGSWQNGQHWLHAIRLRDGSAVHPPLSLEGVTYDPGHGQAQQLFRSSERKQRAALLLEGGAVFVSFGTIAETAKTARGWIIAVDTTAWTVSASWCSTARGSGGGIWMSGAGPATDANGDIYVITGNGDFDGVTDFGESIVKLRYAAPQAGGAGSLTPIDWWTPWTDAARTPKVPGAAKAAKTAAAVAADAALPVTSNFRHAAHVMRRGVEAMSMMGSYWGDQDFGSGGAVVAAAADALLACGKDGILYTPDMTNLGKTEPPNLDPATSAANYAKLKFAPILYTYYDPTIVPAPPNPTALNSMSANRTHHLHGTPLLWQSAAHGWMHFCGGENGNLRAWTLEAGGASAYLACSAEVASAQSPVPPGGMPGWMISLSSNGTGDGIVWALIPYTDANTELSPGRFIAYDAQNFGTFADGTQQLVPLWDSQDWGAGCAFTHPKFNRPTICEGQVYVPTYDGRVDVYGLA